MWRIPALPLLSLAAGLAALAQAPPQAPAPARRDVVVVTGTWEPVPLEEADRAVNSLPAREQSLLFVNAMDLLQLDPSLDLRRRAPAGVQSDLSIRGATFGQTLVLLNGRRMNDPQSGHHSLDIPLPFDAVQAVEVLRGAGSTLYGSDALGGAVNFIPVRPESWQARLRLAGGSFGTQQQFASVSGILGRVAQHLAVSRDFSTGFMPNRDYRSLAASSHTQARTRYGSTGIDLELRRQALRRAEFLWRLPFLGAHEDVVRRAASEHQRALGGGPELPAALGSFLPVPRQPAALPEPSRGRRLSRLAAPARRAGRFGHAVHGRRGLHGSHRVFQSRRAFEGAGAAYAALDVQALRRFSLSLGMRSESYRGAFDQVSSFAGRRLVGQREAETAGVGEPRLSAADIHRSLLPRSGQPGQSGAAAGNGVELRRRRGFPPGGQLARSGHGVSPPRP